MNSNLACALEALTSGQACGLMVLVAPTGAETEESTMATKTTSPQAARRERTLARVDQIDTWGANYRNPQANYRAGLAYGVNLVTARAADMCASSHDEVVEIVSECLQHVEAFEADGTLPKRTSIDFHRGVVDGVNKAKDILGL